MVPGISLGTSGGFDDDHQRQPEGVCQRHGSSGRPLLRWPLRRFSRRLLGDRRRMRRPPRASASSAVAGTAQAAALLSKPHPPNNRTTVTAGSQLIAISRLSHIAGPRSSANRRLCFSLARRSRSQGGQKRVSLRFLAKPTLKGKDTHEEQSDFSTRPIACHWRVEGLGPLGVSGLLSVVYVR